MFKKLKNVNWRPRFVIGLIVGISFVASIIFVIVRLFFAPNVINTNIPFQKLRSDYFLMLMQCALGLFLIFLPYIIERKWKIFLPDMMYVLCFIFLYCAIYLGEVRSFYYTVPHWDTILHALSAAMLATLGFNLVNILNDAQNIKMDMSPFFVAFFAFCFSVACGAIWEIYEYTFDGILHFNMQKFATQTGTDLIGRAALYDTMKDIIVDTLSSLAISILGYVNLRYRLHVEKHKTSLNEGSHTN
ncbi:arginine/ornithine antiporter ArcD [Lachnospiraceae bacterium KM106-2]|nr:arginine/ornithine antiporter ArcD [Lachnospiraceae bacterium KM106-2]